MVHVGGGDGGAERDAGDDRGLGPGVVALHVGGRVGLGVAQRLSLGEGVGVRGARLGHPGEDVVGGAVDDAHHAGDALPHQRLAERTDDRDAPGHRRLEEQVDPGALGGLEELGPVLGEQLLVAGDHGLAGLEGGEDQLAGRFHPADELDHEVDVGVVDDAGRVGGEEVGREGDRARLGEVAHRDPGDLEAQARAGLDGGALRADQLHQWSADVAAPQHPHSHRHGTIAQVVVHGAMVGGGPEGPRFGCGSAHGGRCGAGRRTTRGARPPAPGRRRRTRPEGGAPCCSWSPSSARRRR